MSDPARPPETGETTDPLRLSGREWLAVAAGVLVVLLAAPAIRSRFRSAEIEPDYRTPYALSAHYDLFDRFTTLAAPRYETLLVGDSTVWGQTVTRDQTLSHHLNAQVGSERFANLGVDAMHPVALVRLLDHHASGISGKRVLLQVNPLWMMDEETRGRAPEDFLKNHPRLGAPTSFTARSGTLERIGHAWRAWLEGRPALKRLSAEKIEVLAWSLEHPYESPLGTTLRLLPPSEDRPAPSVRRWTETGAQLRSTVWPDMERSVMWKAVEQTIELLRNRGNTLLVLVGPLNEHMLEPESRRAYGSVKAWMEGRLSRLRVEHFVAPLPPSGEFADICHPLDPGYASVARSLLEARPDFLLPKK